MEQATSTTTQHRPLQLCVSRSSAFPVKTSRAPQTCPNTLNIRPVWTPLPVWNDEFISLLISKLHLGIQHCHLHAASVPAPSIGRISHPNAG